MEFHRANNFEKMGQLHRRAKVLCETCKDARFIREIQAVTYPERRRTPARTILEIRAIR